jgi:hypothetical protein
MSRWFHRRSSRHVANVLDLLTIAAILGGGIWAVVVFAYPITKSRFEPPSLSLAGSLRNLGTQAKGHLSVVAYECRIENTGLTNASVAAFAITVFGHNDDTSTLVPAPGETIFHQYGKNDRQSLLFRRIYFTNYSDAKLPKSLEILPSESYPLVGDFLVAKKKYDMISLSLSIGYAKDAKPGGDPTSIKYYSPNIYVPVFYDARDANDEYYKEAHATVAETTF